MSKPRSILKLVLPVIAWLLPVPSLHAQDAPRAVDPLVKASPYGDKKVWSYHSGEPLPWTLFKPKDYGSLKVVFNGEGVRPVGRVPAPGVHPRIFFSPEDLPAIRKRLKEDRGGQEAWKNILCFANAIKLTYDEKADYAQPDWADGAWHIHGRTIEIHRIGGYSKSREDYFGLLAVGKMPVKTYEKTPVSGFYYPAAIEAFRCLIDDDAAGAEKLAKAVETAVRLDQQRRKSDKPVKPGEPPKPSTPRYHAANLGLVYDFIYNWMTPEQKTLIHDELVLLSSWADNYGTFNNAEASRSNWATFTYWAWDLMAIEGEPGFNDLKFLGLYRGWRNFFNYSFFNSGAAYEAEGKLLFGMDAVVAFDRVAPKYGLELLSQHPLIRSHYAKFTALSVLPTQDKYAIFDILGTMGGSLCTPQDLVVAHYLYPNDATIDFVYRTTVGDDYRRLPMPNHSWNNLITCGIFATSHDPQITPDKLNLPLSFFCGQRAMLMTRSSWNKDATMLTMHVRGASGGHPYPDRNGIMLAAQGRTWVTIPGKDIGGWACNTVNIDDASQNTTTPGRVVDYVDQPNATFMTGDAKYCWDWVWRSTDKNAQGKPCTREDVANNRVDTGLSWKLVDQCFNDFAWTKAPYEIYTRPLKFNAHWVAVDGILSPLMRQVNTPVLKSFRTAGVVRGPRPYVLVIDDVQRDPMPTRYDWNLTLPADVVQVKEKPTSALDSDVILAGRASLQGDGALKSGEPALLIRMLDCQGEPMPATIGLRDKSNLLSIRTRAVSPDFKVFMHAFRMGDPLPRTTWDDKHTTVAVDFPDQKDSIRFQNSDSGKTNVVITRGGSTLVQVDKPVAPLGDPESDALTARLKLSPVRLAALRQQGYKPAAQPGFVAGWDFNKPAGDAFKPLPASNKAALPIRTGLTQPVDGMGGKSAVSVGPAGLQSTMEFANSMAGGPFTVACWLKTSTNTAMGGYLNVDGVIGADFIQGTLRFGVSRALNDSWPAAMLPSWSQIVVTFDGRQFCAYRNGILISSAPLPAGGKVKWGKKFTLGGKNAYGDAQVCAQSIYFYNKAMAPQAVEDLYLWGKYGEGNQTGGK